MEDRQTSPEQKFLTFNEKNIPKLKNDVWVEIIAKKASEPLQSYHTRFETILFKVLSKFSKFIFKQLSHNLLVYSSSHH